MQCIQVLSKNIVPLEHYKIDFYRLYYYYLGKCRPSPTRRRQEDVGSAWIMGIVWDKLCKARFRSRNAERVI
jgi:hypothetical protein